MRGSRTRPTKKSATDRSIPAGAGEPDSYREFRRDGEVYPRGVRGSHGLPRFTLARIGSIPAGAGEPDETIVRLIAIKVYPRGVRGSLPAPHMPQAQHRSIPAGAGEPTAYFSVLQNGGGLSPRVRGSPAGDRQGCTRRRSIPAGAGEPLVHATNTVGTRVYPRGCGGADLYDVLDEHRQGLSPRVRGSQIQPASNGICRRSIPAGAGEPYSGYSALYAIEVYPRGCGGARRH